MSDPPRKRQRTARACTKCRQGKLKCDGALPSCSTCIAARKICSYEAPQKRRGLRSGYVRAMEALLGLLLEQVEGSEDVLIQMLEERFHEGLEGSAWAVHVVEDLAEAWRQSKLGKEMERLIPKSGDGDSDAEMENEQELYRSSLRPTIKYRMIPATSKNIGNAAARDSSTNNLLLSPATATTSRIEGALTSPHDQPTLPQHSVSLIESYFTNVHSWFPIVERHHVYRTYYQYAKGEPISQQGHFSCLLAVLATAEVRRALHQSPDDLQNTTAALGLLEAALASIPRHGRDAELGNVQALLILSLAYGDLGRSAEAWVTVGRAGQMLLHAGEKLKKEKERLPHVIRGYQMLDSILAVRLHLVPDLPHRPMSSVVKVGEDNMEEWASADGIFVCRNIHPGPMLALSTFNQLCDAAHELAEIVAADPAPEDDSITVRRQSSTDSKGRRPNGAADVLTPQQLTVNLIRVVSAAVEEQQNSGQGNIPAKVREFCQIYTANVSNYHPQAIPGLIQPLWAILLESLDNMQTTNREPALQAIQKALSATPNSPMSHAMQTNLARALSTQQVSTMEPSMIPLTPVTTADSYADTASHPVVDLPVPKIMPVVPGLGIQDVDFSLMPELEDESSVPDQSLDQLMAQLQGTTVVPTASAPISPNMGSNLVGSGDQRQEYSDPFYWDNECENSLQNLGFPILDDRGGTTIHPLLDLPAINQ